MKILVPFKRVPEFRSSDGSAAAGQEVWGINPFDEIAIEEAMRIRERGEASEVVGVTIASSEGEEQIRAALAMGLDRVIRVDDGRTLDPYAVSRILEAVVRREEADLVLMGKQAVDDDCNQTGQMLAGLLGWPQATFISRLELGEGPVVQCDRETDGGVETVAMDLPAVVTTDLRLNEPRYVSLPGLMRARRRPIEVLSGEELGIHVDVRTTVLGMETAPKRQSGERLESVGELVKRLREVDKVL